MPTFLMVVAVAAASHALAGRADEAQSGVRRLREIDPAFRLSTLADWLPIRRPEDRETLTEGLRRAGLAE